MRAPLTISAALVAALLAAAPAASALTLQTSKNPTDGADLSDPDSGTPKNPQSPSFLNQRLEDNGTSMRIGNGTLHFGVTNGANSNYGGNQWFLDSPASRTVPSQMH
jgi:hypothetical protein